MKIGILSTLVGVGVGKKYRVNFLTFRTFFLFCSNKMLVIKSGVHKMLVRIANRVDPDQTGSLKAV